MQDYPVLSDVNGGHIWDLPILQDVVDRYYFNAPDFISIATDIFIDRYYYREIVNGRPATAYYKPNVSNELIQRIYGVFLRKVSSTAKSIAHEYVAKSIIANTQIDFLATYNGWLTALSNSINRGTQNTSNQIATEEQTNQNKVSNTGDSTSEERSALSNQGQTEDKDTTGLTGREQGTIGDNKSVDTNATAGTDEVNELGFTSADGTTSAGSQDTTVTSNVGKDTNITNADTKTADSTATRTNESGNDFTQNGGYTTANETRQEMALKPWDTHVATDNYPDTEIVTSEDETVGYYPTETVDTTYSNGNTPTNTLKADSISANNTNTDETTSNTTLGKTEQDTISDTTTYTKDFTDSETATGTTSKSDTENTAKTETGNKSSRNNILNAGRTRYDEVSQLANEIINDKQSVITAKNLSDLQRQISDVMRNISNLERIVNDKSVNQNGLNSMFRRFITEGERGEKFGGNKGFSPEKLRQDAFDSAERFDFYEDWVNEFAHCFESVQVLNPHDSLFNTRTRYIEDRSYFS